MQYYYLKNGKHNSLVRPLLVDYKKYDFKNPSAAIFFGNCTLDDLKNGKEGIDEQAISFYKWCTGIIEALAIVVSDGKIWILKPIDDLMEMEINEFKKIVPFKYGSNNDIVKLSSVKVLYSDVLKNIPVVLANIGANQYLIRGTFRDIDEKYFGNILAIESLLKQRGIISTFSYSNSPEEITFRKILTCLASIELETLIAKLLEEMGLFIPAYFGGTMKDIDLFAYNKSNRRFDIDERILNPGDKISMQIKGVLRTPYEIKPDNVDYLFQVDGKLDAGLLNADWLKRQLSKSRHTKKWLLDLLDWLPQELKFFLKEVLK